jgi:hypothetical protein
MTEKRADPDLRSHAHDLYAALLKLLEADQSGVALAKDLLHWNTLDQLLQNQPKLFPCVFDIAWNLRHKPELNAFFQGEGGAVVEEKTAKIAPLGKSLSEIILYHLLSAMRLRCESREKAWLADRGYQSETEAPSGFFSAFLKILYRVPPIRSFKDFRKKQKLKNYPSRDLFDVIKNHIKYDEQFELMDALSKLPTERARILGSAILGLNNSFSIECLGDLDTKKLQFILNLSKLFATVLIEYAASVPKSGESYLCPLPIDLLAKDKVNELTGKTISEITKGGLHLTRLIYKHREEANDVMRKACIFYGQDVWKLFVNPDQIERIAACPKALAAKLGGACLFVPLRTSTAFKAIPRANLIEEMIEKFSDRNANGFQDWVTNPDCSPLWETIASDVKSFLKKNSGSISSLLDEIINQYEPKFLLKGRSDVWLESVKQRMNSTSNPNL